MSSPTSAAMGVKARRLSLSIICVLLIWIKSSSAKDNCVTADGPDVETWKVTSVLVDPFLMEDGNSSANATGNDRYKGYIKDLLEELSSKLGKTYEIVLQADNKYGKKEGDSWTGMVGEVCKGAATMVAAPLTVTVDREGALDFTYKFMAFQAMAVIARLHWTEKEEIRNLQDLLDNDYKLGVLKNSVIAKSMAASADELHQKAWNNINKHDGFKDSNNEGVTKARSDVKYAYLLESSMADYVIRREPCDLDALETTIYQRRYAIGVQQRSSLRDKINAALVDLEYDGTLDKLYDAWWGEDTCSGCFLTAHASAVFTLLAAILAVFFTNS